jgi:ubiquinone/menaquinone biosynthesis C-methylase UbiE
MEQKPRHLSAEYAEQFADASVVAAYAARPPYPDAVFDTLASLLGAGPKRVLELGCGSGDLTLGLAPRVQAIDAVDPAEMMLERARSRAPDATANVRWIRAAAEQLQPAPGRYALVVAAESFHWMEWSPVLRMIAASLRGDGVLAFVTERRLIGLPWAAEAQRLVAEHSTNQDYRPYDLIAELTRRNLFREAGRRACEQASFSQSVDAYVESFHSRNGFSRERMSTESAAAFDAAMRKLVLDHAPSGIVTAAVATTVVWGRPTAG